MMIVSISYPQHVISSTNMSD